MPIRCALIDADVLATHGTVALVEALLEDLVARMTVGLVHVPASGTDREAGGAGPASLVDFELPLRAMGLAADDPTVLVVAASAGRCFPRELVVVAGSRSPLIAAAEAAGTQLVPLDDSGVLADLSTQLAALDSAEVKARGEVGRGPHQRPWPTGEQYDPHLLAEGDRRNVVDGYRYWTEEAIVADLDRTRLPLHVAVENWQHDLNIGTVVRNANAFNLGAVHIVGKRRWNRRGAMATDRYLHLHHHATVEEFRAWATDTGTAVIGIDNVPGSVSLRHADLPRRAVLLFGQEGPGLSTAARDICQVVCEIPQLGSTRSLNAGVASGIAMYEWVGRHGPSA